MGIGCLSYKVYFGGNEGGLCIKSCLRSLVWAQSAAGVASAMKAVETIPRAPPIRRLKSSAIVSIFGSSKEFLDCNVWKGFHE